MAKKDEHLMWRVPKLWPGGTCFIIGGGPSLTGFDIERLRGKRIIAVNCAFKLAPWIDVMYYGDCMWPAKYGGDDFYDFKGLKVTTCPQHTGRAGVRVVKKRLGPYGLSKDPTIMYWNLSSGACAINLAFLFGVKKIVLLGFDMDKKSGKKNWHDYYKDEKPKHDPYARFKLPFPYIKKALDNAHVECVNANLKSALDTFSKVSIDEVLNDKLSVCA